jgi:hypothetical protein
MSARPTSPASDLPLLRRPGTYEPADATRRAHVVGTLDAVEDAHVVVAGLRVILAPGDIGR